MARPLVTRIGFTDNAQVTDYLIKRGYTRTEEAFRKEIAGGNTKSEEEENKRLKPDKYVTAFEHLLKWVDNSLDLYKVSLRKSAFARRSNTSSSLSLESSFGPSLSTPILTSSSLSTSFVPNLSCSSTRSALRTSVPMKSTA